MAVPEEIRLHSSFIGRKFRCILNYNSRKMPLVHSRVQRAEASTEKQISEAENLGNSRSKFENETSSI